MLILIIPVPEFGKTRPSLLLLFETVLTGLDFPR